MDASIALGLVAVVLLLAAIVVLRGGGSGKGVEAAEAAAAAAAVVVEPEVVAPNGAMQIFFGSQTGTAEGFAKTISDEAKRRGFAPSVVDLEDFDEDEFEDDAWLAPTLVFAMATYGEGEPTDNAHAFLKWAKRSVKDGEAPMARRRFSVFGLGNRQYQHYNAMGILADDLCEKLGGDRCADLGLGDDDADLEADFDLWRERLWASVGSEAEAGGAVELEFDVVLEGGGDFAGACAAAEALPPAASTKFYGDGRSLTIREIRELRSPADGGSTLHVELAATGLVYETADNLAILPENGERDVAAAAAALGAPLDARFCLRAAGGGAAKLPFPTPCTVREALTSYCDLTGAPSRRGVAALSAAAGGPDLQGRDAFSAFLAKSAGPPTLAAAMTALGGVADLKGGDTARLLAVFLEKTAPRLRPREYTVSSSSVADAGAVHVTVAIAAIDKDTAGVTSALLARGAVGGTVRAFARASSFRAPTGGGGAAPVVLVGPGTGVAPMRAILRERTHALAAGGSAAPWGPARVSRATLYFGCKRRDDDHLYADEMAAWVDAGALDALHVAYSREQAEKVYVQDLIREPENAKALVADLVKAEGALFVCGGTAMGASVGDAIKDILTPALGSRAAAEKYVEAMVAQGRYVQELWS